MKSNMKDFVPSEVVMIDILFYWIITVSVIILLDFYAKKKLGKNTLGYKALKIPKFLSLIFGAVAAFILFLLSMSGLAITREALTFCGVPFFTTLIFYMSTVFRRIKAERN